MALDRGDEDILARALTKALRDAGWRGPGGGSGGAGGGGGGGGDPSSGRRARKLGDLQQKLIETSRELLALDQNEIENTLKGQRLKKKHDLILQEASRSLKQATDEIKPGTFSQMYADVRAFSRNTEGLTSKLAQATKNASMFSAGLLQSHELIDSSSHAYRDFMSTLGSAAGKLNNSFLRQNRLIDDITGEIRDNIDPADIAQLRVKTGRIQAMMIEQLSSLGLTDVSQLTPEELARRTATGQQTGAGSAQEMHRAILTVARQLQAEGLLTAGDLSDATTVNYAELAQAVQEAGASLSGFSTTVDAEGRRASTVWNRYVTGGLTTLNGAINNFARNLTNSGTIVSNMGRAVDASKAVYQDMMKFNVAGLTTGFAEAQVMSVKMGMSFEDTVSYLQENKRLLGLYGSTEFEKLNSDFKSTFQKFGYTMQQGAAAVGPTIEAAITAGINIRSGEQLNRFMEQTAAGFAEVRGYIAESLPEYARLNAALYNEAEVKSTLLGLDKQRSALYAQSLVQQRNDLIVRGLSTQQAQEMVKLQEQAKRERVSGRIKTGAMLAIQAQQMGLSPEDARRAMQVHGQGGAASREDTTWLTNTFLPQFAKAYTDYQAELAGTGAGAQQMARDIFMESTEVGGPIGQMIKGMQDLAIKQKAGVGATKEEQERIKQQSAGSAALAEMGNAVNSVTSILNNNFAKALLASSQALLGLAGQAGLAGLASVIGGAGGLLGTTVGLGAGMAAFAGQLALAGAVGLAAYTATSALLAAYGVNPGDWGANLYDWMWEESDKKEREEADAAAASRSKQKTITQAQLDVAQGTQISPYAAKLLADSGINVPANMIRSQGAPAAPTPQQPITPAEAAAATVAVPAEFASPGVVPGTAPGAPVVNTAVQGLPVGGAYATSVSDLTAQQKLEIIASNMIEAVSLLKQISTNTDAGTREIRSARPIASVIPNQSSYLTGRVQ